MEPNTELSESEVADQLGLVFTNAQKSLNEAQGKSAEQIQAAVNTNIMTLGFGITQIFNRIKNITPGILGQLNSGLTNFWTTVSNLLKTLSTAKIKDWKVGAEMTISAIPSTKFTFSITCNP